MFVFATAKILLLKKIIKIHIMGSVHEPFIVAYCGVSVTITPVVTRLDMQYMVDLPTRSIVLETEFDEDDIDHWVEVPGGRTEIAGEIGALIESRDM